MRKNTDHEFQNLKIPQKEESRFILPADKQGASSELEELAPLFNKINVAPQRLSWAQIEKEKARLTAEIKRPRNDFLTTLKDCLTTSDSLFIRCVYFFAILVILALLALGGFFVYECLTATTAEAALQNALDLLA